MKTKIKQLLCGFFSYHGYGFRYEHHPVTNELAWFRFCPKCDKFFWGNSSSSFESALNQAIKKATK